LLVVPRRLFGLVVSAALLEKKHFSIMGGCGSKNNAAASKPTDVSPTKPTDNAAPANGNSGNAAKPGEVTASGKPVGPGDEWKKVHSAVRWNKPEAADLLNNPSAVNSVDPVTKNQPIHIAAQNGHFDLVKLLLERGADPNSKNGKDNTPLHMAIGYDYYECAQLLIKHGADIAICNGAGVPGDRGLEGDKCFGIAAFVSAEKSKVPEDVLEALKLCLRDVAFLDKASFAQVGMKAKKSLGENWTAEMNDQFKNIMMQL
jgi:hypothetical protein